MTAVAELYGPPVRAEVVPIALALIDRDPKQPRFAENVDANLAPSFKEHGWFESEPLEVRPHPEVDGRYMLVDGERRYAGAKAAGLKEALCVLTLDVEGVREGDRLVRQIIHNSGKPLTPVEEAFAFKRIVDDRRADVFDTTLGATLKPGEKPKIVVRGDPKYGPVQLARELGLPKSTVSDRLAMMEIPSFWLKLIIDGPLQPSHVPALHKWRKLPEKFQLRGLEKLKGDYKWPGEPGIMRRHAVTGDRLYIGDFEHMLDDAMRTYVRPISEVPGYKGPTERLLDKRGWPRTTKTFAMDPAIWQPIARKKAAERAKKRKAAGAGNSPQSKWQQEEAERSRRHRAQQERDEQARKAIKSARPKLLAAFQAAVNAAKFATLRDIVVADALDHGTPKSFAVAAHKANTAEAVLRALAMAQIAAPLHAEYRITYELPKIAKRWKVDVAKLVKADAEEPEEKAPDPATAAPVEAAVALQAADEDEDDG